MIEELNLKQCSVHGCRLESLQFAGPSSIISARAFAPLDRLFEKAVRFSDPKTIWLLPKGRTCQNELDHIRPIWRGEFSVEQSITDRSEEGCVGKESVSTGRARWSPYH